MRALLSIVGIVTSCWMTIASASPIEDDAFSAFEVLCLLPSDPVAELPNTVKRIGFVAMSRDQIDKSFEPGTVDRAWVGKGDARPFIVFLTRSEGCGLSSPDASGDAMASLIRNQPSARELRSDVTKVPFETDYAMLYVHRSTGRESRYVVTLLRSPRGVRGVELIALSEAVLQRLGRSPTWPVD